MTHICPACNKVIEDFDRIKTEITSTYHPLKSSVVYALDPHDMRVVGALHHENCNYPKGSTGD